MRINFEVKKTIFYLICRPTGILMKRPKEVFEDEKGIICSRRCTWANFFI